jgi:hypothetical protein
MAKKSFKEIYALAVCFFAVGVVIVNGANGLYYVVRIVSPGMTMNSVDYERLLSDDAFLKAWPERIPLPDPASVPRLRAQAFDAALRVERRDGMRAFIESFMYIISGMAAFISHWIIARREQQRHVSPEQPISQS